MPLINCPDCGIEHSDLAISCPKCGRPAPKKNKSPFKYLDQQRSQGDGKGKKPTLGEEIKNMGIIPFFLIVAVVPLALLLFAPRITKNLLRVWDPLLEKNTETRALWSYDGGYTYTCYGPKVWGVCLGNESSVHRQCTERNEMQRDPNVMQTEDYRIVNAYPKDINVEGGTCKGTLYTEEITKRITGWQKISYWYCRSPLVRKNYNATPNNYVPDSHVLEIGGIYWFPHGGGSSDKKTDHDRCKDWSLGQY